MSLFTTWPREPSRAALPQLVPSEKPLSVPELVGPSFHANQIILQGGKPIPQLLPALTGSLLPAVARQGHIWLEAHTLSLSHMALGGGDLDYLALGGKSGSCAAA